MLYSSFDSMKLYPDNDITLLEAGYITHLLVLRLSNKTL